MIYTFVYTITFLLQIFRATSLSTSAVLGVDLGTEYIKATLVKPGIPLEIVLTKDSRRKELSVVAFKNTKNSKAGEYPERLYGSDAAAIAYRFPGDVYPNLKALLGLKIEDLIVKEYSQRYPSLNLVADSTRGTSAFRSAAFLADEHPWTVEEILAMELQNIQKNAQALAGTGSVIKNVVITVPAFYTVEEKRALLLAADLAGLRVLELISDGLAVGLNYATTRTLTSIDEGGKAETHLVFDMGAGSTKATILKFQARTVKDVGKFNKTIHEVKVLGTGWDKTLGGDALNTVIVDHLVDQFIITLANKKVVVASDVIKDHGRTAAKLWKEAERIRQVLSANAETQASFEGLYEEHDFKFKITRAEFEDLIAKHIARIPVAIQNSLSAAKLEIKDLDSVILHGGASRTPFVQKEVERFIGDSAKIKSNVNSDESAVFGAGFRGATLSPSFRVKEIRINDSISFATGFKWTNTQDKLQHQILWKPTSHFGAEKHYTFKNKRDPFTLEFYQQIQVTENDSTETIEKETLTLTTSNLTDSVMALQDKYGCAEDEINLRLSSQVIAQSGEVVINELIVDCEVEISEGKESVVDSVKGLFGFGKKDQAPLTESTAPDVSETSSTVIENTSTATGSSDDAKPSQDSKKVKVEVSKRFERIPISYTIETKGLPKLPATEITRMMDRLARFADSDKSRRMRDEALNQLEGFTYEIRDLLDDEKFVSISSEKERADLKTGSHKVSEWLEEGGVDASREELLEKFKELKDIVTPIENRKTELASRPEKVAALRQALNETSQIIASITEQIVNYSKTQAESIASQTTESASSPTETPSSSIDDQSSSEVDGASTTESAPTEQKTPEPPAYTEADLLKPQELYDQYSAWLVETLASQEKLKENDDPVLLCKDLEEKTKELQNIRMELIMKGVQHSFRAQQTPPKSTSEKPEATKSSEDSSAQDSSSSKTDSPEAEFTMSPGMNMPSEEEIQKMLEKIKADMPEHFKGDQKPVIKMMGKEEAEKLADLNQEETTKHSEL